MVTRDNTQLTAYTLPVVVINTLHLIFSCENLIFTTTSVNVSVISYDVSLATILLLDLLIFH